MTKSTILNFIVWTILACVAPIGFIIYRFDLFQKVSKVNIGGWGLVVILIVFVFAVVVKKNIKKGITYSRPTAILTGLLGAPLLLWLFTLGLYFIRNNMDVAIQVFLMISVCETLAALVNPFPKWINDNKQKETDRTLDILWNRHNKKDR